MSTQLKTVNIKGKEYVEVSERLRYFRESEEFKDWSIETEIIDMTGQQIVMKSNIKNQDGIVKSVGHAYEKEGSSFINKTSYIENCETSAIGRALGILGIGIEGSVASALEVKTAVDNQHNNNNTAPPENNYNQPNDYPPPPENNYQQPPQNNNSGAKMASENQAKAIYAISNSVNMTNEQAKNFMKMHTGKNSSKDLTSKEASVLIGKLKEMQDGH